MLPKSRWGQGGKRVGEGGANPFRTKPLGVSARGKKGGVVEGGMGGGKKKKFKSEIWLRPGGRPRKGKKVVKPARG